MKTLSFGIHKWLNHRIVFTCAWLMFAICLVVFPGFETRGFAMGFIIGLWPFLLLEPLTGNMLIDETSIIFIIYLCIFLFSGATVGLCAWVMDRVGLTKKAWFVLLFSIIAGVLTICFWDDYSFEDWENSPAVSAAANSPELNYEPTRWDYAGSVLIPSMLVGGLYGLYVTTALCFVCSIILILYRKHRLKSAISVVGFLLVTYLIPHNWCAREASSVFSNTGSIQSRIAKQAELIISREMDRKSFKTGSELFNGEWLFGSYMMSGMGFGQMAVLNPGQKEKYLPQMEKCIRQMLSAEVREFDRKSWENDPIDSLDSDSDHAAYLGYFNLLLSFHRLLKNESEFSGLNDRISSALARRLEKSRTLLLQTYPGEYYPVDNCAVIASIGLYDRATGSNHSELIGKCLSRMKNDYTDKKSGLLFQCVDGATGIPGDSPCGSGTSLGLYFLSFVDPDFSLSLYKALTRELDRSIMGFGGIKEYPASVERGNGDIDSGPVIFGYGFSATGFTVAGSRIHDDYIMFRKLYATVYLFGAPYDSNGKRNFVIGGPIGNSIIFAMLTALDKNQFDKYCRSNGK